MTTELKAAAAEIIEKMHSSENALKYVESKSPVAAAILENALESERAKVKELEEQNARLGYRVKRLREALSHYHEGYIARQALREMAELDAGETKGGK